MFCEQCGAKNNVQDAFCAECGAPLVHENVQQQPVTTNVVSGPKKPMSKKTKIIIAVIAAVAILFGVGYKIGSDATDPKKVAEDYIQATVTKDADKLYKYLNLEGDTTFVSKKIFKNIIESNDADTGIENFKITGIEYGTGKLTAKVKFTYTMKESTTEHTDTVSLVKQKEKKYLFFDNWKISDNTNTSVTIDNFSIKVAKGSTVTFAGIKLTKDYLDKDESTSTLDVYKLPQVFTTETKIKAVLSNGMEIEEDVTPSTYRDSYTITFDEDNLSESAKEKITSKAKSTLTTIYTNVIANKAFSEFKSTFEHGKLDLTDLESSYTNLASDLASDTTKLTSINFKTVTLYSVDTNEDGNLKVKVKANYDYSVSYTDYNGEVQTHDDSDYDYITFVFAFDKNSYYVVDADNLIDYFSRY